MMFLILQAIARRITAKSKQKQDLDDEESSALLDDHQQQLADGESSLAASGHRYGSIAPATSNAEEQGLNADGKSKNDEAKEQQKEPKSDGNVLSYLRRFFIFIPYIWPYRNRRLLLNVVGVVLCLIATRFLKVLGPRQLAIVINSLRPGYLPVSEILLYILFNFIESSGIEDSIRGLLWYPIEANARKTLSTSAYSRVMELSRDYHDNKKSGELYKSIEQGTAVCQLLETVFFEVVPIVTDLLVACGYLAYLFGGFMALTAGASVLFFLTLSKYIIIKQVDIFRERAAAERQENQTLLDSVGGWVSVAYFNNFHYELTRYSAAIDKTIQTHWRGFVFNHVWRLSNDMILQVGFVGACFVATYQVSIGQSSIGSFVLLLNYWERFSGPLTYFGYLQKSLQEGLINAELLLELLQAKPTVKDGPATFALRGGAIAFDSVNFSYDGVKTNIHDLSFSTVPGQTIALVGETGSGKSTILNLLFRFYDVRKGSIRIDDQDIRSVTVESLRQNIGVVPQDPMLFNDSVMNNVRYSKLGASDDEVINACKAAAVHEKILTFTDGYATTVGENGVKLSGGEKQRIAIARAILKDPKIILLDEATSSVDTRTEFQIQKALKELTKGRTTFVVAHRLSTVMEADIMLVIKNGAISEKGPPKELLRSKGEFLELWSLQNTSPE